MALIVFAARVQDDFDRIFDQFHAHRPDGAEAQIETVVEALGVLAGSPQIGRPAVGGQRELVIGRGTRGYVALYRYLAQKDVVLVLAIRGQRASGLRS